ncbi:MAG: hypothetical protein ACW97O_07880, partial [Candidatus Thorarchaeota archaeon]
MEDNPYISTLSETGPLQSLPRHIFDRLKRSARDPDYFNAVTFETIGDQYLEECYHYFYLKWKEKEWGEIPECWQKKYWKLRKEYKDFLGIPNPGKWKVSRIISFLKLREEIFKPEMEHKIETVKEFICWRYLRERYSDLWEKANKGDQGAITKLDLLLTKLGHTYLDVLKQLDK